MADDIKLNNDSNEVTDLDKMLDDLDFDSEYNTNLNSNSKNSSGPVDSVLSATKQSLSTKLDIDYGMRAVSKAVDAILPSRLKIAKDNTTDIIDNIVKEIEPSISELKSTTDNLLSSIEMITGDDSSIGSFIGRVRSFLGLKEENVEEEKENEDAKIQSNVNEILSSIINEETVEQLKQSKISSYSSLKTNELLAKLVAEAEISNRFNRDIADKYYRKSLELQYKHVLLATKMYELEKDQLTKITEQLEAVVKNTALPDVVKLSNGEYLKHTIKDRLIKGGIEAIGKSNFIKDITSNISTLVKDKLSTLTNTLGMFEGMTGMLGMLDTMEYTGISKEQIIADMVIDSIISKGAQVGSNVLLKKLLNTEKGKDIDQIIEKINSDPKAALEEIRSHLENTDSKTKSSLLPVIEFLSNSINRQGIKSHSLMSGSPDDPTVFDNKTKRAITTVIPTYLAKIHRELVGIRTGKYPDKELVYDFYKNKFTNTKELKKELIHNLSTTGKEIKESVSSGKLFDILEKDIKLTPKERKTLQEALVKHLSEGGTTSTFYLGKEIKDKLPVSTYKKFMKILDKINNDKTEIGRAKRQAIQEELNSIKSTVSGKVGEIYATSQKASLLGRTDILEELGLVTGKDHTEITADNMSSVLDKINSKYISGSVKDNLFSVTENKVKTNAGIHNIEIPNLDKIIDKLSNIKVSIDTSKITESINHNTNKILETTINTINNAFNILKDIKDSLSTAISDTLNTIAETLGNIDRTVNVMLETCCLNKKPEDKLAKFKSPVDNHDIPGMRKASLNIGAITEGLGKLKNKAFSFFKKDITSNNTLDFSNIKDKTSGISESFINFFNIKYSSLKTKKEQIAKQLEENISTISKEIEKDGIENFLTSRLAMLPLPSREEEQPFYETILRGIDPTGRIELNLKEKLGGVSSVIPFLRTLHISALKNITFGMAGGIKNMALSGLDFISRGMGNVIAPLYNLLPTSVRNKLDNTIIGRFVKGEVNVFKEIGKGALKTGKNLITKNLKVLKDTAKESFIDEHGRIRVNLLNTARFLGKAYYRTAKVTGKEVLRPLGEPIVKGLEETGKHALRFTLRFLNIEKNIPVYRRTLIVENAPIPDEVKSLYFNKKIRFKDIPKYLTLDEQDEYYKYLKEWKKIYKDKRKYSLDRLVKKAVGTYTDTASRFGKTILRPTGKLSIEAAKQGINLGKEFVFGNTLDVSKKMKDSLYDKYLKYTLKEEYKESDNRLEKMRWRSLLKNKDQVSEKSLMVTMVTELSKIKDYLKPKKKSIFDKDGDGLRDGSWMEQLKDMEDKNTKKDGTIKRIVQRVSKSTSIPTLIFGAVSLLYSKFKNFFKDGFLPAMGKIFKSVIWEPIKWLSSHLGNILKNSITSIFSGFKGILSHIPLINNFFKHEKTPKVPHVPSKEPVTKNKGFFSSIWDSVKNTASKVYHGLHIDKGINFIKNKVSTGFKYSKELLSKAWKFVTEIPSKTAIKLLSIALKSGNIASLAGKFVVAAGKKIPLLALAIYGGEALHYALKGDWERAALSLGAGAVATVPVVGTIGSIALDYYGNKYLDNKQTHKHIDNNEVVKQVIKEAMNAPLPMSPSVKEQLAINLIQEEGIRLNKYVDSMGYETIGIGHLLDPRAGGTPLRKILGTDKDTLTPEELAKVFKYDVTNIGKELFNKLPWLSQQPDDVKVALLDMAFNLGVPKLLKFKKALNYIKNMDYKNAIKELLNSKWAKQVPNRARSIVNKLYKFVNRTSNITKNDIDNFNVPPTKPMTTTVTEPTLTYDINKNKLEQKQVELLSAVNKHIKNLSTDKTHTEILKETNKHQSTMVNVLSKSLDVQTAMLQTLRNMEKILLDKNNAHSTPSNHNSTTTHTHVVDKEHAYAINMTKDNY